MRCSARIITIVVALLVVLHYEMIASADIIYNAYGRPTQISGLDVDGTLYDVSIDYNVSFMDIYGDPTSPSPVPAFWGESTGAQAAATAMANALNAEPSSPALIETRIFTGYQYNDNMFGTYIKSYEAFTGINPSLTAWDSRYTQPTPNGALVQYGWAQYTEASVPEPSSFVIFAGGSALGLLLMRRRYKR